MAMTYFRSDTYWEEQDLSQAIAGVATSIGAIVGASKKGPLGKRLVTTVEEYNSKYGEPDAQVSFMGHCGVAFLQESNQLWVNRVVGAGAQWGNVVLHQPQPVGIGGVLGALSLVPNALPDPDVNGIPWSTVGGTTNPLDNLLSFYAEGPGGYSRDLSVAIKSDNLTVPVGVAADDFSTIGIIIAGVDAVGTMPAGIYEYGIAGVSLAGETPVGVNDVTLPGSVNDAPLPGGVAAFITWDAQTQAIGYSVYRRVQGATTWGFLETIGASDNYYVDKGNVVPDATRQPATNANTVRTKEFLVEVYDATVSLNNPVETFPCTLKDYTDGMGRQLEITQQINGISRWIRVQNNVSAFVVEPVLYDVARTNLGAGNSGSAVLSSHVIKGWSAFSDEEDVEVRLLINGGYAIPSVQLKMDSLCHSRKDCMAILDVPALHQGSQRAIDYRNITLNLNSNRSALYCSDVLIEDEFSGKRLYVPPSGHVAGVYAYTDATTFPWRAPAGMRRGQLRVLGVRHKYNKAERDNLWRAQINYIRDFKGLGRVVWEQRTMQGFQSGFSYVNVRRLMDTISIALRKALLFQEFEPNDEFLQMQIRSMCENYLLVVKQARGIRDYMVVCDKRNNQPWYTDLGQLNVDIFIKPTLPAEKIRIRGTLTNQGAVFAELIAAGALS